MRPGAGNHDTVRQLCRRQETVIQELARLEERILQVLQSWTGKDRPAADARPAHQEASSPENVTPG